MSETTAQFLVTPATLALAQCQRLARCILNLGGRARAQRIARRIGVSEGAVNRRLKSRLAGHCHPSLPLFVYDKDAEIWSVTQEGRKLARAPKVEGHAEAFTNDPGYSGDPSPSRRVRCPGCRRVRRVGAKHASDIARDPNVSRLCRRCVQKAERKAVEQEIACPVCHETRTVSRARALRLALYPDLPRTCRRCADRRPIEDGEDVGAEVAPVCLPVDTSANPALPTMTVPGTPERMEVLGVRAEYKLPLFIPGDCGYRERADAALRAALATFAERVGIVVVDEPEDMEV